MVQLQAVDELEIFVLMDNISDPFTQSESGIPGMNHNTGMVFVNNKPLVVQIIVELVMDSLFLYA